jgi:hypothetical protein
LQHYQKTGKHISASGWQLTNDTVWTVDDPPQRSRLIRVTSLLLCATLLISVVLLQVYDQPFSALLYAKSLARKTPELWKVPKPLELESRVPVRGKIFCRFGFQFTSPWTDVSSERNLKTVETLIFSSGEGLVIFDESKTFDALGTPQQAENNQTDQAAKTLFGYAFRFKVLSATPADLHWFSSRQRMASSSTLLAMKSLDAPNMKGGIYSFHTPWFRGFQIGSPSSDKQITVELFDPQDLKFKLLISSRQAADGSISQSDINQIISRLQPASLNCN